ncbi:ExeA family protein [Caenimonas soli]|uniref:ExeA family protein n=1 Tax=Caenimonas soli TaxID=2735555 RepID=UPI001552DBAB|nr:ExeA family protein [Caenimonas soli]NPC56558.1 AAA family ATPase [Caenimonas soli]
MYVAYFGLKHEPFSIAPDPRYLFMSERHREALAHLVYGVGGGGGFVLLSGEIGTGKTTVCRLFLEQIPANCNVAYIFNPKLTVTELLQSVCEEFHVAVAQKDLLPPTVKDYLDPLNEFLLQAHAAGRNNVLIIDEAQNLSAEVLEQLRLLTNLETSERKLLQIILIGQPELRTMLAKPELEQLAQRVIARFHLDALTPEETDDYIAHRLEIAGLERPSPFERKALQRIHQLSRGVPRRINLLCDRALLGAFANSQASVNRGTVEKAAVEVFGSPVAVPPARRRTAAVLGLGLAAGAGLFAAVNHVVQLDAVPALGAKPATVAVDRREAPPPVAAPPAPAQSVTAAPTLLRDPEKAWRELAQSWQAEPGEGEAACKALPKQQLHCFSKNLSLALIRELGRPGIVTLDADTGSPSYAILTGLTRDSATLRAAGTEQTVTLAALAARWQGDFATLWRAPPGYSGRIADGRNETVGWIATRLAAANGSVAAEGPRALDAPLRSQLRTFQLSQGLPADGMPGPLTFMQLNRAAGVDEPRLRTEP